MPIPDATEGELDRDSLLTLYKSALEEYRFQVNLGWERQKFFIGLNVSLLAGLAGLAKLVDTAGIASVAFIVNALSSLLGVIVVTKSHSYYRSARAHFQRIELRLRLDGCGLALMTTPGMREGHDTEPRLRRFKVVHAVVAVLVSLVVLDLIFAVTLWR